MWLSVLFSNPRWSYSTIFFILLITSLPLSGRIYLNDAMSQKEQRKTGVADLNYQQKLALEQWLNDNFVSKNHVEEKKVSDIYLSQNINNGKRLELSDGSLWEVSPLDVSKASFWIVPFPLELIDNSDPRDKDQYPKKIVNKNTNVSIKVRMAQPPEQLGSD